LTLLLAIIACFEWPIGIIAMGSTCKPGSATMSEPCGFGV